MRTTDEAPARPAGGESAGVTRRPRALLAMNPALTGELFPPQVRGRLEEWAELSLPEAVTDFQTPSPATLALVEVLVTGWGCAPIDAALLARTPRLRAVIHAAGTVKTFLHRDVLDHGVVVSSAAEANAVPVAEFTLAAIVFGAKRAFSLSRVYTDRRTHRTPDDFDRYAWVGGHGLTVGVIGASRTGRRVIELLSRTLEARILLYDPYVDEARARALGAEPCDLDTLLAGSDVVTVHAPATPLTHRMLDARRLALMRPGALLVNTARGSLVDTQALTPHLVSGRLDAVLDVTDPEPLPRDHPLWDLPNVFLTPHLAGAQGNEAARLGAGAVEELRRYARGEPLRHPVRAADWDRTA
ncbi:hydroxyacid dehydrogenase [Streptomyces sp. 8L]|uniref:hydroxyacid dehydrogenase n=1 Tax=Streptomyces sp. 8L TaxID=2877242 RepID=UPI0035A84603